MTRKHSIWRMHHKIEQAYVADGHPYPVNLREMARWAIERGLWMPQESLLVTQLASELAEAMREEHIVDPQGRSVRAKHAVRRDDGGKQISMWADIRTAPREYMAVAFAQRRRQIVGDCRQLETDVDSFNENRCPNEPIQMSFDFTADLAEMKVVL